MSSDAETMKKNKRTLMPKLRFPEFRDEQGWVEVPLEQIAGRITTKNLDGKVARVLTNSAEHGIVDQRDYFDKDIANASNIDGYYIVDLGDYVYNPRISALAPVGPISRNNIGKGVMSPLYTVFRFAEENTDFYQHYFKAASWHSYLRRVSSMGARHDRMSITTGDFMAMPVPTPLAAEQQKIAECLSSLDGLITAEGRTLEALKAHKKGLMQQLFPQPGQTQPRLRFPEFRDEGEWETTTVGESVKTITPPKRLLTSEYGDEGRFPIVDQSPAPDCGRTDDADAILTKGLPFTIFGDHTCVVKFIDQPFAQGADGIKILKARSIVDDLFLYFLLQARPLSSTQYKRHFTTLKEQEIIFPDVKSGEQQRIAACLSALDTQIAAQAAKIESLKQHKRGLMQQLFPPPEEQ